MATYAILSYTNPEEMSIVMHQLKDEISINSICMMDYLKRSFDIVQYSKYYRLRSPSPTQYKEHERFKTNENPSGTEEAVIYNIEVPPLCWTNFDKCDDLLTPTIIHAFETDGVIALRGLLTAKEINGLKYSSNALIEKARRKKVGSHNAGRQFYVLKHHAIFDGSDEDDDGDAMIDENGFRHVALSSLLPHVVHQLLRGSMNSIDNEGESTNAHHQKIRVIRDVFLAKDEDPFHCGWHVDDTGFWPCTASSPGINAWIAIDDMPLSTGGGFALSVGSHTAEWRKEAYDITGSTHTLPDKGYRDVQDMFDHRGASGTCNIKNAAPHLHKRMEEKKRVYDVQAGDIILHTRWLFHRTVPFEWNYIQSKKSIMKGRNDSKNDGLVYRRYSVRYSPGNAVLPKGYGTELSLLQNPELQGKALDLVTNIDGPWYPMVWPSVDQHEVDGMREIRKKIKIAEVIKKDIMKEMKPYLQEIGRQQRKKQFTVSFQEKEKSRDTTARTRGNNNASILKKKYSGEF